MPGLFRGPQSKQGYGCRGNSMPPLFSLPLGVRRSDRPSRWAREGNGGAGGRERAGEDAGRREAPHIQTNRRSRWGWTKLIRLNTLEHERSKGDMSNIQTFIYTLIHHSFHPLLLLLLLLLFFDREMKLDLQKTIEHTSDNHCHTKRSNQIRTSFSHSPPSFLPLLLLLVISFSSRLKFKFALLAGENTSFQSENNT